MTRLFQTLRATGVHLEAELDDKRETEQ